MGRETAKRSCESRPMKTCSLTFGFKAEVAGVAFALLSTMLGLLVVAFSLVHHDTVPGELCLPLALALAEHAVVRCALAGQIEVL